MGRPAKICGVRLHCRLRAALHSKSFEPASLQSRPGVSMQRDNGFAAPLPRHVAGRSRAGGAVHPGQPRKPVGRVLSVADPLRRLYFHAGARAESPPDGAEPAQLDPDDARSDGTLAHPEDIDGLFDAPARRWGAAPGSEVGLSARGSEFRDAARALLIACDEDPQRVARSRRAVRSACRRTHFRGVVAAQPTRHRVRPAPPLVYLNFRQLVLKGSEPPALGCGGEAPPSPDAILRNPLRVPNPRWAAAAEAAFARYAIPQRVPNLPRWAAAAKPPSRLRLQEQPIRLYRLLLRV